MTARNFLVKVAIVYEPSIVWVQYRRSFVPLSSTRPHVISLSAFVPLPYPAILKMENKAVDVSDAGVGEVLPRRSSRSAPCAILAVFRCWVYAKAID